MPTLSGLVDIDYGKTLCTLGYTGNRKVSARTESLINQHLENARHLVVPVSSYIISDIEWVRGSVISIQSSIIFQSNVIARLLEQCDKAALFVVTIGDLLEEKVSQLARERLVLKARVLDAIGSVAVESVADNVQDMISKVADAEKLHVSQRFSPGYCDWDISQQRMLFQAMNGDNAGVQLTEQCLMIPRKSVSGIIGIGSREVTSYNPCRTCDKPNCIGRR